MEKEIIYYKYYYILEEWLAQNMHPFYKIKALTCQYIFFLLLIPAVPCAVTGPLRSHLQPVHRFSCPVDTILTNFRFATGVERENRRKCMCIYPSKALKLTKIAQNYLRS